MSNVFDENRPCTIEELQNIITAPACGLTLLPNNAYDEVLEGIFIGEGDSAKSVGCMKRLGVTHVLNAAQGKDAFHVDTNPMTYKRTNIQFLGIKATDFINCDLSKHFYEAAEFIEAGITKGGKVFVHCVQGASRSATLVIAYLMIKCYMTVQEAMRLVREKREVCPNPGFLQQLCSLNEQLKKLGHFNHQGREQTSNIKCEAGSVEENVEAGKKCLSVVDSGERQREAESCDRKTRAKTGERTSTVQELEDILTEPSGGLMMLPSTEYSKIDAHIYIGEGDFALNLDTLGRLSITHVLNAAYGKGVNSNPEMYEKAGIQFLGIKAMDTMTFDMSPYWDSAADFISSAVTRKGRIFVCCVQGVSRSATLVIAYFMVKHHLPVQDSTKFVRTKREICPNSNFLQQLCNLHDKLRKAGHF